MTFWTKHFHTNNVTEGIGAVCDALEWAKRVEDTSLSPIDREEQTPVVPETPTSSEGLTSRQLRLQVLSRLHLRAHRRRCRREPDRNDVCGDLSGESRR